VVHRDEVEASVLSVNPSDQFTDLSLQLRRIRQAGTCHLDENDLPPPLWVVVEKLLEGLELLNNTLHDIELIPADDNFLALVQCAKGLEFGLDARPKTIGGGDQM
jgi:hypothetical protein